MSSASNQHWWEPFYDEWLSLMLLEGCDDERIEATLEFIEDQLDVSPGDRIFDQCCGIGRLTVPLAERGYEMCGIDQADNYIRRAREAVGEAEVDDRVELTAADAFDFTARPRCDAVINWWTSFGYASDDETNARMLQRAYESLKPGGWFALDMFNTPYVVRYFQPETVDRRETDDGEVVLVRESCLDLPGGLLEKHWTYFLPDGRRVEHDTSVRLYMPHRLAQLLEGCGFESIRFFGGVGADRLTADSPRCISLARKPHPE